MHFVASRHSRLRPGLLLQELIDGLQASVELLAFHHAVDFLQLGQKIAATELDLLARAAGTRGVGVNGHEVERG